MSLAHPSPRRPPLRPQFCGTGGSSGCITLTTFIFFVVSCVARPHHEDPFFACYNMDLSVMVRHFASVDELVAAATSPFFVASVFDIASFSKPKTIASVESVSCLDFIMSAKDLVTTSDTSRALTFHFS